MFKQPGARKIPRNLRSGKLNRWHAYRNEITNEHRGTHRNSRRPIQINIRKSEIQLRSDETDLAEQQEKSTHRSHPCDANQPHFRLLFWCPPVYRPIRISVDSDPPHRSPHSDQGSSFHGQRVNSIGSFFHSRNKAFQTPFKAKRTHALWVISFGRWNWFMKFSAQQIRTSIFPNYDISPNSKFRLHYALGVLSR